MKKWKLALMMAFALLTATSMLSCDKDDDDDDGNGNNDQPTVTMPGMVFSPANLQVATGTVVTWNNNDNEAHTVTADNGSFDSGDLAPGESFQYTFEVAGTYTYHCQYHVAMGMVGTITVVGP